MAVTVKIVPTKPAEEADDKVRHESAQKIEVVEGNLLLRASNSGSGSVGRVVAVYASGTWRGAQLVSE